MTYLNHGTVGVVPKRVLAAQQAIRDQIERQPAAFLLRELWNFTGSSRSTPTLLRESAALVAAFVARARGAVVRTIPVLYPRFDPDALVDRIAEAIGPHTRLVIVDHIAAESALVFPVAAIAERCHAWGVPVLVDGAHAPGGIVLDVPTIGADYYVATLHKWACAPRSCGFLWVAPRGGPRFSDRLLRWSPDPTGGIWNATQETELPG